MTLGLLIRENYLVYLLLFGLIVVMYAYRHVKFPDSRNFQWIIFILFVMCAASGIERWAGYSPDQATIRTVSSIVHYILQPLVFYLELIVIIPKQAGPKAKVGLLLRLLIVINTVVYLIAPFTGRLVFYFGEDYAFNRGPLGYSIYIITLIYLVMLLYFSYLSIRHDDKRKGAILLFMAGSGFLTGLLELLNVVTGFIDEAFALGLFLYYMYLITLHESEMQTELTQRELELSRSKVKLLRQQIRPHFVFNSLQIIKSLIRSNEDKAVKCLEDFSDYLRANIDAISSDQLVSFDQELSHIEAYVSLALADESKAVRVEYDIKERNFSLPPLSIEPLVENAIRHGVRKGGTVTLATRADQGDIVITVSDDGEGFQLRGTEQEKERMGTGLANVRSRIASQVGGSTDIQSDENGTVVTIRIPNPKEP